MSIEFTLPTQTDPHTITLDPATAALVRQFQLEQLVRHLFEAARTGATLAELTAAAREAHDADADWTPAAVATRVFETHRANEQKATTTRALIADALDGYPANTWLEPIIVDAAAFTNRAAFWTREA